jgi:hypothetical protein
MTAQNATVENILPQRQAQIHAIERRTPPPAVPEYVSHREDVTEIGKLSAEAMVKEYESTAKEIEAMGDILKDMVQRCEQLAVSANAMLGDVKATAMRYRKEGKRMFNEIEACSNVAEEVRRTCETFRDKIAAKSTESAP